MSQVQKLESLLSLVQRNRHKARAVAEAAPMAAPTGPGRASAPSPLEVAIGGATNKPPAPARRQVAPQAPAPRTSATPSARPGTRATPAAQPTAPTATPIAAAAVASPSTPVAMANETVVVRTPKTFGELLTRSLSLRPR